MINILIHILPNEIDQLEQTLIQLKKNSKYLGDHKFKVEVILNNNLTDWSKSILDKNYFESKLFNNNLLNNLMKTSENKIVLCAKENRRNHWSKTLPQKYYNKYCFDHHIIGGFFGGKKELVMDYCRMMLNQIDEVLENENTLYLEENIMSLIYYNHKDLFNPLFFDIWWHEDDNIPGVDLKELTKTEKSFYKILEELNGIEFQNQLKVETQNKINKIFNN
jgi:rhodanese-related sulfurtransferase